MTIKSVFTHGPIVAILASLSLLSCTSERAETVDEILSRYEQEGVLEFLAPTDQQTGETAGPPTRDAFRFLTSEAEARFLDEVEFESAETYPDAVPMNSTTDWICYGESSHTSDTSGLIRWNFRTQNNSTRTKKQATVSGAVFHSNGLTLTCSSSNYVGGNDCQVYTTISSGYNSSVGQHRCCEKKGLFGSYDCTGTFGTTDAL